MFKEGFKRLHDSFYGIPDRVPFIAQMHEFSMIWSRESGKTFYSNPEKLVNGIIHTAEDFGFDIPCLGYDVYNIEAEALGLSISFPDDSSPATVTTEPLIRDRSHLDDLRLPNPYSSGRMPFVIEANKLFEKKTGYPAPIQFTAPFSLAVILRGYENFIQDLYINSNFAHDLLNIITDKILAPWILALRKESPNASVFRGADAMASLPLINIQIIQEFVIPYIQRLQALCGEEVTVINWWGESYLNEPEKLLDLKLKISPTLIQGQDPDVEKIGPEIYKQFAAANNATLILGIGNQFLETKKEHEIRSRIARYIEAGSPNGRFIIYFCNLSPKTPPDNVRQAIAAVKEYGRY